MRTEQHRVAGKGALSSAVLLAVPAVLRALNFGRLCSLREQVFLVHPALLWFMAVPGMEAGQGALVLCARPRGPAQPSQSRTCSLGQQIWVWVILPRDGLVCFKFSLFCLYKAGQASLGFSRKLFVLRR